MVVVKIGGSLGRDPLLPDWLQQLSELGRGRVVIVPGGGGFADQVRDYQARWGFGDLPAHNMAVLAMVQYALMLHALCPRLTLATGDDDIRTVLRQGGAALWTPYALLRAQPDAMTNWDATSDSIAACLSERLGAQRLVLVKSCEVAPGLSLDQYVRAGVLDRGFTACARAAACAVEILHKQELDRLCAWLRENQAA
ncbi:aspartate kinase [Cupriavidus sp. IK-TO18]|uniref:amino acid kinase family protein n=1 Tax=Cupriavidus sp. IK-TO18 TaxID=2782182 RepID=UPI00189AC245|nr:aspartate kinase [Cupriavidus sp. IK-TO18]MBF6989199.1 aspartate kinase [Cupriavidus sp. IK-TO18]